MEITFNKKSVYKSLIKNAEYKKIPKSSYPVSIVQIDSIKSIAYCNIYQFILKMVRKHRIVKIVLMKGIVIFGQGMTLRVSAGNINEKIKKILSVCVLLKIVFFIIIVVYHKYVHFQIFFFIWNFLYTQPSDFFHKFFFI